jgi:hypothetical protein
MKKDIRISTIIFSIMIAISGLSSCSLSDPNQEQSVQNGNVSIREIAGFPVYTYLKNALPANLNYNPTGELIFPCIIDATEHIAAPKAKYYLYYAPHDAPGGICLSYANNIEGPYTEYSANPLVKNVWPGKYSVTHVSAPNIVWMPQYNKYFMYYHGENTTIRWAYSTDGISWNYGGVCLKAGQYGSGYTESSYQKVYEYTIPGKSNRYIMLHMLLYGTGSGRKIALSVSQDGKTFTPYDSALISPAPDGEADIAGPLLYRYNNGFYVIYNGGKGNMYMTEVGSDFTREKHMGVFHTALAGSPDNGRCASPSLITVGTARYMFYEAGERLHTTIVIAKGK